MWYPQVPLNSLLRALFPPRPAWRADDLKYDRLVDDRSIAPPSPGTPTLGSRVCRQSDFESPHYRYWAAAIKETPHYHRKQWEFCYIAQALYERGMLREGRSALGFGVGSEPLPSLFASMGVDIVATDQSYDRAQASGWVETNQHAASLDRLNDRGICPPEDFLKRVSFVPCDMNEISKAFAGRFDFCWSACCLEHLGSLEHGANFILNSIATLRPGGIAVHTTEYNLSSNFRTLQSKFLSIFRRRDIEKIVGRLEAIGCDVEEIDWSRGDGLVDGYVDLPPYRVEPHIKLRLSRYDCTSIGLIITRRGA